MDNHTVIEHGGILIPVSRQSFRGRGVEYYRRKAHGTAGLRVLGDNARQCISNNTVETGSNGQFTVLSELASYLTARWRRSSANWFPMLPPLPRDKTALLISSFLLFHRISPAVSHASSLFPVFLVYLDDVSTFLIGILSQWAQRIVIFVIYICISILFQIFACNFLSKWLMFIW